MARVSQPVPVASSLVTSERGIALLSISIEDYLLPAIVSRLFKGEQPTGGFMIGYREDKASLTLNTFLSRIDGVIGQAPQSGVK